ncbi:MAG: M1 family metallopeptidase [Clostridia bacterium]
MKIKKFISILTILLVCIVFLLCGCKIDDLKKRSQGLNDYNISMSLHPESHSISAVMEFCYKNQLDVALNALKFNLYPNAYREDANYKAVSKESSVKAYPNGKSYGNIEVTSLSVNDSSTNINICGVDSNILEVAMPNDIFKGDSVNIEIAFKVNIANIKHRLGYIENTFNIANFYPSLCYMENGAFLEYPYYSSGDPFVSEIANYDITFVAPCVYTISHTGDLISTITENNISTHNFKATCVRDFAIVASSDTKTATAKVEHTDIIYNYITDNEPDVTLKLITDCFQYFNDIFGLYPYKTYCVTQTNFCYGGMEYPNLIYVANDLPKESYHKVIIHETAHQWWYALVGNNQIKHAWLDEGLAEYSVILFYEHHPQLQNSNELLKSSYKNYRLFCDVLKNYQSNIDTSLTRSIPEYPNNQTYVCLNYLKSMLLFDSLRSTMKDKKFFKGLNRYFKTAQFTVATPETLIGCFEKEYGAPLTSWFNSWLGNGTVIE